MSKKRRTRRKQANKEPEVTQPSLLKEILLWPIRTLWAILTTDLSKKATSPVGQFWVHNVRPFVFWPSLCVFLWGIFDEGDLRRGTHNLMSVFIVGCLIWPFIHRIFGWGALSKLVLCSVGVEILLSAGADGSKLLTWAIVLLIPCLIWRK